MFFRKILGVTGWVTVIKPQLGAQIVARGLSCKRLVACHCVHQRWGDARTGVPVVVNTYPEIGMWQTPEIQNELADELASFV